MTILQALVLGLVQGVTEFLPISSSGFLILVPELLGWDVQSVLFDAVLHLASLGAILFILRREISEFTQAFLKPTEQNVPLRRLGYSIVIATLPVLVFGYFFRDHVEMLTRSQLVVAGSFIIWGIVLFFVDLFSSEKKNDFQQLTRTQTFLVGVSQIIALIPGTSRSGITITAGRALGWSREVATRFSFLLAVPTLLVVGGYGLLEVSTGVEPSLSFWPVLVGALSAGASAFVVATWLIRFVKKATFRELALLRIVLGFLLLLLR